MGTEPAPAATPGPCPGAQRKGQMVPALWVKDKLHLPPSFYLPTPLTGEADYAYQTLPLVCKI